MRYHDPNANGRLIFPGLDSLRGYAAIAVVVFHCSPIIWPGHLMQSGYLAVDLFFVMSGFVVAHAYEVKVFQIGLAGFIRLRLVRFLPLFLLGGLIGLIRTVAQIATGHEIIGIPIAVISYLLFLPSPSTPFSDTLLSPLNPPAWSLMLELYINIIWAFSLPYLTTKRLFAITCLGALCCLAALVEGLSLGAGSHFQGSAVAVARILYSFPLGLLLYRFRHTVPSIRMPAFAVFGICMLVFSSHQSAVLELTFAFLLSPLLVICASRQSMSTYFSRYGASSSYCIYILHMPGTWIAYGISNKIGISPIIGTVIWIVLLLVIAPLVDLWFDKPARSLLLNIKPRFVNRRFTFTQQYH